MSTRSKDPKGMADAPAAAVAASAGGNAAASGNTSAGTRAVGKVTRSSDRVKGSAASSMTTAATTTTTTLTTSSGASTSLVSTSAVVSGSAMSSSSVSTTTVSSSSGTTSVVTKTATAPLAPGGGAAAATENAPPPTQVDKSQCAMCGAEKSGSPEELMECRHCGCGFHARCANLPQTPEEGEFFCRWECFTAFRKNQDVAPKTPLGDFSRLSARVQTILGELPRRVPMHVHQSTLHQPRDRERDRSKRPLPPTNGRSRSPSPIHSRDSIDPHGGRPANGYERHRSEDGAPRRPSPVQLHAFTSHVDLTLEDDEPVLPRSPRSRPRSAGRNVPSDVPFDGQEESRGKRLRYSTHGEDVMINGGRRALRDPYGAPARRMHSPAGFNGAGAYGSDLPHQYGATGGIPADMPDVDRRQGGYMPLAEMFDHRAPPHRAASGSGSSRVASVEGDRGSRPSSGRSSRPGSGRYSDRPDNFDPMMGPGSSGRSHSRPPSSDHFMDGRAAPPGRGYVEDVEIGRPTHPSVPPAKYNIPWRNPAAFPAGLRERFNCLPDNVNGVFRIDLTPVFADKTMHLYQSEIDFFFRCFESADVSLVVKGMASELNQYIWAWPFILESCGSETHFSFDHFQFRHRPGELPELEYVGELRLSMASYNAYLERYLSGSMTKETVALEDHVTKKTIHIVAAENIIALNNLVIADHCAQLHNDLVKSFQWDVFAGGIHCLLQYLPQASRHKRFSSPILHFNFPGARGRLRDPGNGTTDQAYQVLVGSLELVIFERLEPKERDTFHRLLLASGYDPDKKSMLLDSHLRVLRDAGFAWSTVLLTDGEFIHVNKGRLHFWRVVEPDVVRGPMINSPCVFLSWEWVYQGVSQRGISTECWFAMKNASLCTGGWAFDPRRAIVEAAKCGVAIVRTGQFLNSIAGPSAPPVLTQLAFTGGASSTIDREVIAQRQEQMVLFLESILPCMDAIVEEEFELGLVKDDGDDFRKIFDDEIMWKPVDTGLSARHPVRAKGSDYECGICSLELTNIYKQCLGCTVHARRSRPNVAYKVFRICLRCHAQPEHHLFKPRALHGFYDKLCSSEGHTGLLPATRRYQAERSYFKCRCTPYVRCTYCGGCESCCCLCHTLFQTRFRYSAPEHLDHLRTDVVDVIKWHKQQLQHHHAHQR